MQEKWNAITHGIGASLALAGLIVLIISSCLHGGLWHIVSSSVYGASLFLLFLASTLYHSFRDAKLKYIFKIVDHSAIYVLIAGTYTPFAMLLFQGTLGWAIFGAVWSIAIIGIVFQILFVKRFKIFSTLCYLVMGWLIVLFIKPLAAALSVAGISWLIAGGLAYTVGAVFYLQPKVPYNHTIWHLFVLAGSAFHFITIFYFVLPMPVIPAQ